MATEVKLPRLGQGMESGTIVKWLKGEGEPVKKREPLYELDTDKVTQEVEAEADGVLLKIVVPSGEVEVGRTIAFIGNEGEDVPSDNGGQPAEQAREGRGRRRARRAAGEEGSPADEMDDERERGRQAAAATAEAATASSRRRAGDDGGSRQGLAARAPARTREGNRHRPAPGQRPRRPDRRRGRRARRRRAAGGRAAPAASRQRVRSRRSSSRSTRKTIARRLTEAWQAPVFQLTSPST